jgi:hypothetical protein
MKILDKIMGKNVTILADPTTTTTTEAGTTTTTTEAGTTTTTTVDPTWVSPGGRVWKTRREQTRKWYLGYF